MERLTYKSCMGDYGVIKEYKDVYEENQVLRNALGWYEDIVYKAIKDDNSGYIKMIISKLAEESELYKTREKVCDVIKNGKKT